MIPLRDENPSSTTPGVTRAIIALNVAVFVYQLILGPELTSFVRTYGLVPAHLTAGLEGRAPLVPALTTLLSSMFLHGGWLHLIGNMWYLWIFGDNVEDRLGHAGYLAFYLAAGLASGLLHSALQPSSTTPTVGASGAIAGVLGAYVVLYPRARVVTLFPIFFFFQIVPIAAIFYLGFWFVLQIFSGALSLAYGASGGVAWWGHIGGFAFGLLVGAMARARAPRLPDWDTIVR
jgi:membrane associated rhomboid family serine protease